MVINIPTPYPLIKEFNQTKTNIDGLYLINLKQIEDDRGTITELFRYCDYDKSIPNIPINWKQTNLTISKFGVIRGIHAEEMTKLVSVIHGEGFGVYVDLRKESKTLGNVFTTQLSQGIQVLVPNGVGNCFQSVSENGCHYLYCFDKEWQPSMKSINVNPTDIDLQVVWPIPLSQSILSSKDLGLPRLKEVLKNIKSTL